MSITVKDLINNLSGKENLPMPSFFESAQNSHRFVIFSIGFGSLLLLGGAGWSIGFQFSASYNVLTLSTVVVGYGVIGSGLIIFGVIKSQRKEFLIDPDYLENQRRPYITSLHRGESIEPNRYISEEQIGDMIIHLPNNILVKLGFKYCNRFLKEADLKQAISTFNLFDVCEFGVEHCSQFLNEAQVVELLSQYDNATLLHHSDYDPQIFKLLSLLPLNRVLECYQSFVIMRQFMGEDFFKDYFTKTNHFHTAHEFFKYYGPSLFKRRDESGPTYFEIVYPRGEVYIIRDKLVEDHKKLTLREFLELYAYPFSQNLPTFLEEIYKIMGIDPKSDATKFLRLLYAKPDWTQDDIFVLCRLREFFLDPKAYAENSPVTALINILKKMNGGGVQFEMPKWTTFIGNSSYMLSLNDAINSMK